MYGFPYRLCIIGLFKFFPIWQNVGNNLFKDGGNSGSMIRLQKLDGNRVDLVWRNKLAKERWSLKKLEWRLLTPPKKDYRKTPVGKTIRPLLRILLNIPFYLFCINEIQKPTIIGSILSPLPSGASLCTFIHNTRRCNTRGGQFLASIILVIGMSLENLF